MQTPPRPALLRRGLALALTAMLTLSGCAGGSSGAAPSWSPQPASTLEPGGGPGFTPGLAEPGQAQPAPGGSSSSGRASGTDPQVVATGLAAPTGLVILPDGTALVGERTTGRIVQVQPVAGQPVTAIRTLTGLDTGGDGGLLDLALSPTYDQDGLIYAYVTTPTDNRVIAFTLTGPATPVFTGIPKGSSDNRGRIMFDAQGNLLIGTGDAGQPALAADPASLAGKVLRVSDVGQPLATGSPVFTSGQHTVAGLCLDRGSGSTFETEPGAAGSGDEINTLSAGANYGWPVAQPNSHAPTASLPPALSGAGGCAVAGGVIYVASLNDDAVLSAPLTTTTPVRIGAFTALEKGTYGRLLTVVAAPDGALWLTTSNKDGHGKPVAADERVIRIMPNSGSSAGAKA